MNNGHRGADPSTSPGCPAAFEARDRSDKQFEQAAWALYSAQHVKFDSLLQYATVQAREAVAG